MPQPLLKLIAVTVSFAWLGLIVELVRRGRLREDHALFWLVAGVVLLFLSLFGGTLRTLAAAIGVVYAPSLLFGVGLFFVLVVLLFQGIALSRLQAQNKELAQHIALLEHGARWRMPPLIPADAMTPVDLTPVASDPVGLAT